VPAKFIDFNICVLLNQIHQQLMENQSRF